MGDVPDTETAHLTIDEGFRRWYASCPCCLGESYPDVKAELDRQARTGDAPERTAGER